MNNRKVNTKIINLFKIFYKNNHDAKSPLIYNNFEKSDIIFIGLNPSFSVKRLNKKSLISNINPIDLYSLKNIDKYYDMILENEKYSRSNYKKYFSKIIEIADENKLKWEHIDVYFERETNQSNLLNKYKSKNYIYFAKNQYNLFYEILELIDTKLFICINAGASKIIQKNEKDNLHFSEEIGTYYIKIKNKKVPIIFSGMLTGQRALDLGSFERLKWHIRLILNKK